MLQPQLGGRSGEQLGDLRIEDAEERELALETPARRERVGGEFICSVY